jgi:hypothetical protein
MEGHFKQLLLILLTFFFGSSYANTTPAQIGVWTNNGPHGGFVRALAIDPTTPTTIYAGTDRGVFRSIDGGKADRSDTCHVKTLDSSIRGCWCKLLIVDSRLSRWRLISDVRRDCRPCREDGILKPGAAYAWSLGCSYAETHSG